MRLQIRSKENYFLNISSKETLVNLKAKISEVEHAEYIGLYVAGKPVDLLTKGSTVESLHSCTIDVVVLLKGGKVRESLEADSEILRFCFLNSFKGLTSLNLQ
jgi:hypothetical protein